MEGYSGDNSSETKEDTKDKKVGKAAGLGGRSFEFAKKTDAAEKIADASSIWEKLIPKERPEQSVDANEPAEKVAASAEDSGEEIDDPSVDTLSAGEKAEVAKDYAQAKQAELEAGRTDAEEPAEAAAREANIEYLQEVQQEAEATPLETVSEDIPVDAASEAAPAIPSEDVEPEPTEFDEGPAEFTHDEAVELNPLVVPAEERGVEDPTVPPMPLAGGSATPPTPPVTPPTLAGRGSIGPDGGLGFNTAPAAEFSPPIGSTPENNTRESSEGAYFLAGGILGYMLGRRRGRIKTERRMKAVSQKLEQQINETQQQIKQQEIRIRDAARRAYKETQTVRGAETTAARTMNSAPRAETTELTRPETKPPTAEQAATIERVQHMQHHEVLAMAEKITIDGTSLRKIYEAKQITEPGLRRLTQEYLRGGDLKASLQHELQVKEMQYERDPQMRDRLAASYAGVDAASPQTSSAALATLLAQGQQPTTAHLTPQPPQPADEAEMARNKTKQLLISAWAVLIVVLVIVVVVLAAR